MLDGRYGRQGAFAGQEIHCSFPQVLDGMSLGAGQMAGTGARLVVGALWGPGPRARSEEVEG
eukprot:2627317-Pyramimonas_sp.AAC.1